jgi:hypothetical protein
LGYNSRDAQRSAPLRVAANRNIERHQSEKCSRSGIPAGILVFSAPKRREAQPIRNLHFVVINSFQARNSSEVLLGRKER